MKTSFCLGVLLLLTSCVSIEKGYPDKRYYVLSAMGSGVTANPSFNGVLMVANFRVSPRYEGKSFVYRRSEANFESDFYNQFLVSPGALLTEEVRRGLARAQIFQYIVSASSRLEPTHILEGSVNALYGDFRDTSSPRAVLEMEFFLSRELPANAEIVTQKRYSESVAVNGRSPEALVKGWNEALEAILSSLVVDLKSTNL